MTSTKAEQKTEIVHASELGERVIQRVFELRNPDALPSYRKELAIYKRRLGKRQEKRFRRNGPFAFLEDKEGFFGFQIKHLGETITVKRPMPPKPVTWAYQSYTRSSFMGQNDSTYARDFGLLADPRYNRNIRKLRVDEYASAMQAGAWVDLLSDPIAITSDGQIVNGQHRLAAASRVDWDKVENDPAFLVVWGVEPNEALHADGSRRTPRDEKTIATKLVTRAA